MKGFSQVRSKLKSIDNKILQAGKEGVYDVAETIFEDSRANFVPIDTGELYNSARLDEIDRGKSYSAIVSYNTDYAIFVHEISYYRHSRGKSKYLETPFNKHVPKLKSSIQKRMERAL